MIVFANIATYAKYRSDKNAQASYHHSRIERGWPPVRVSRCSLLYSTSSVHRQPPCPYPLRLDIEDKCMDTAPLR